VRVVKGFTIIFLWVCRHQADPPFSFDGAVELSRP
jgi:hypothetical protein